jgi:hypothetical protein
MLYETAFIQSHLRVEGAREGVAWSPFADSESTLTARSSLDRKSVAKYGHHTGLSSTATVPPHRCLSQLTTFLYTLSAMESGETQLQRNAELRFDDGTLQ